MGVRLHTEQKHEIVYSNTAGFNYSSDYINPIPAGLVLTGIVVSVSVTSITLALTDRLYKRYKTLNLDEVYSIVYSEHDEKEVK